MRTKKPKNTKKNQKYKNAKIYSQWDSEGWQSIHIDVAGKREELSMSLGDISKIIGKGRIDYKINDDTGKMDLSQKQIDSLINKHIQEKTPKPMTEEDKEKLRQYKKTEEIMRQEDKWEQELQY